MTITHKTILRFCLGSCLGAVCLFACDKGEAKTADKGDAKAADKAEPEVKAPDAEEPEAKAEPEAKELADSADVEAGARVEVAVDASGYHPAEIKAPAKSKVTLAFTRATDQGCGQKLVIADMELEKDLPLGESVEIEVEVPETGELGFACGMNMYKGKVVPKS